MKYLRLFNTQGEYSEDIVQGDLHRPSVSFILENKTCLFNPKLKVSARVISRPETDDYILSIDSNGKYFEEKDVLRIEGGKLNNNLLIL